MLDLHGETRIRIDPISLERPKTSKFKAQRLGSLSVPVCPQFRRCTLLKKKSKVYLQRVAASLILFIYIGPKTKQHNLGQLAAIITFSTRLTILPANPVSRKKPNISLSVGFKWVFRLLGFPIVCHRGLGLLLAVPLPIHGDRTCCPTTTLIEYCFS